MKNKLSPLIIILGLTAVIIGLLYLFNRNSSQNNQQSSADPMHSGAASTVNNGKLNAMVGNALPGDIQLSDKDGKTYTPADFKGKYTVLFFNEGLMCYPACWNQISSFGSDQRFNSQQIQAVSVVTDSAQQWQNAIAKMPDLAKSKTLFDSGAKTSKELGMVTNTSSMHPGSLPGHTYLILDPQGIVRFVFDDPNMAIQNDMLFSKINELSKQ